METTYSGDRDMAHYKKASDIETSRTPLLFAIQRAENILREPKIMAQPSALRKVKSDTPNNEVVFGGEERHALPINRTGI